MTARHPRTGRFISGRTATAIARASRQVRGPNGRFGTKQIIVNARTRPKGEARYGPGRTEVCRREVYELETGYADPTADEIARALDREEPGETHFLIGGSDTWEEVEE